MTTMERDRGRRNTNERGSSVARRRRKQHLLDKHGDGETASCWECGAEVTFDTMVVDRITPGYLGGTYTRTNIRIHCCLCSCRQGQRLRVELYVKKGDCNADV